MSRLAALFAALALAAGASEAFAHASLVSSLPADGAVLAAPPSQAVLTFDEPVAPIAVRLVDDTGSAVSLPGAPRPDRKTIRVELPAGLREGTYLLSFRVTSADTHPVAGAIAFGIGRVAAPAHRESGHTSTLDGWRIAVRAVRDLALLIAAGGALFLLCVAPFPGERRVVGAAGAAAAALSIAGIGLQGAALAGPSEMSMIDSWLLALHTSFGLSALVAPAAALVIAVAAGLPRVRARKLLLAAGALASAASLPLTGHAASALAGAPARLVLAAHALAAAFWTGSLVALYALLTRNPGAAGPALRRFSTLALGAVAALIAAGVAFSVMQLAAPGDLISTGYGRLILAKAALLLALLIVAARNRVVLMPLLERSAPCAASRLRRSVTVEIALIGIVIALTAVLTQTRPGNGGIVETLRSGAYAARLTVTPGRAGHNAVTVTFQDSHGKPYDPAEAALEMANPAAGIEPIVRALVRAGPGEYRYEGRELAFAGPWSMVIQGRIGDFERIDLTTTIHIR